MADISSVVMQARGASKTVCHWKESHEKTINLKISEMKDEKKQKDSLMEREVGELVSRNVPFEYLAKDWLDEAGVTLDSRAYLLEKLIPTLVMAVEKLLLEAERRDIIDGCGNEVLGEAAELFNPVNFLAQFLMRNNPRYSNFSEASPYAKTIHKLLEDLKASAYNMDDKNRLAQMKSDAKKRREEREAKERIEMFVKRGKPEALSNVFVEWTNDRGAVISLSLVQSALRSFEDYVSHLPADVQRESMYAIAVESTDVSGKLINIREFVEYVGDHISTLSEVSFKEFIRHMSHLAQEYRTSIELEGIRNLLAELFTKCDHGQLGSIDRQRVLTLLNLFYDGTKDPVYKQSMRNPRKWPVIEFDEEEDEVENYIKAHENDDLEEKQEKQNEQLEPDASELTDSRSEVNIAPSNDTTEDNEESMKEEVQSEEETVIQHTVEEDAMQMIKDEGSASSNTEETHNKDEEKEIELSLPEKCESAVESASEVGKASICTASKRGTSTEPEAIPGVSRPFSVTSAVAFDRTTLNENQFVSLLINFLGEKPMRSVVESLIRYIKAGYVETEEEREKRQEAIRREVQLERKKFLINQLFELWDADGSGYLEINEIEMVLAKWREEEVSGHMFNEACEVFESVFSKISKGQFHKMIDSICSHFPDEDVFDSLIQFLTISVQRSFEERKRSEFRRVWMHAIDFAARTSGCVVEPLFKATLTALENDAVKHGKEKKISAYIALLEKNDQLVAKGVTKGDMILRYVAATVNDMNLMVNRVLHRGMKCISFSAVDSGKPIHVPRVLNHGGIHLWNPVRRDEKIEGSFICLPLKDRERNPLGIIGVDTLADPHERAVFVGHEISFYQGVAKSLSQALQFVDARQKTIKVSESAVSWILRRSPNVHEVIIYLVEPALKESDGSVLRKMVTLNHSSVVKSEIPPRLERKDNLFRDYLFKCIDTSETLTADAYGERHLAFPLRDGHGMVMSIVDISIGNLKQLPPHELKEIHRMLKLLEMAHKEMSSEAAGEVEQNIVLEVEKEHEEHRIDVLFDRIMLQDLRANVGRLDARAFAEIKHYKDPPKIIHTILKAVLGIYFNGKEDDQLLEKLEDWTSAKMMVDKDLVKWITNYDPTAGDFLAGGERLATCLADIQSGAVSKHGSLPAQYLFNWAFVCLSLIEHASKMRDLRNSLAPDTAKGAAATSPPIQEDGKVEIDRGLESGMSEITEATMGVDQVET